MSRHPRENLVCKQGGRLQGDCFLDRKGNHNPDIVTDMLEVISMHVAVDGSLNLRMSQMGKLWSNKIFKGARNKFEGNPARKNTLAGDQMQKMSGVNASSLLLSEPQKAWVMVEVRHSRLHP